MRNGRFCPSDSPCILACLPGYMNPSRILSDCVTAPESAILASEVEREDCSNKLIVVSML